MMTFTLAPACTSLLVKAEFVSPLTFQALSRNEVYTNTFEEPNPRVIAHIDAADWADLVIVAPASSRLCKER